MTNSPLAAIALGAGLAAIAFAWTLGGTAPNLASPDRAGVDASIPTSPGAEPTTPPARSADEMQGPKGASAAGTTRRDDGHEIAVVPLEPSDPGRGKPGAEAPPASPGAEPATPPVERAAGSTQDPSTASSPQASSTPQASPTPQPSPTPQAKEATPANEAPQAAQTPEAAQAPPSADAAAGGRRWARRAMPRCRYGVHCAQRLAPRAAPGCPVPGSF